MFQTMWVRQVVAALRNATVDRLPEQATAWPNYFDNTNGIGPVTRPLFYRHRGTGVRLPFKGAPGPIPAENRRGVEAHITAVSFGTTRRARSFWRRQIDQGLIPAETLQRYTGGAEETQAVLDAAAERMALHQRFWKVPYHYVGLLNGDVLLNNAITRRTFHGNGGNSTLVGVALEGNFPGLEKNRKKKHNGYTEHTIETGRSALRLAITQSREQGALIGNLYAHRQYSDGRLGDPGSGWWKEIGIPVAEEMGLERPVDESYDTGVPICREWDPLGSVNYHGRPA